MDPLFLSLSGTYLGVTKEVQREGLRKSSSSESLKSAVIETGLHNASKLEFNSMWLIPHMVEIQTLCFMPPIIYKCLVPLPLLH